MEHAVFDAFSEHEYAKATGRLIRQSYRQIHTPKLQAIFENTPKLQVNSYAKVTGDFWEKYAKATGKFIR